MLSNTSLPMNIILCVKLVLERHPVVVERYNFWLSGTQTQLIVIERHTKSIKTSKLALIVPSTYLNDKNGILDTVNDLKTSL